MAHFAQLDENNVVRNVIVVGNADCLDEHGVESEAVGQAFIASVGLEGRWVQTSYNRSFRKNYAGIGSVYDEQRDAFIAPKPDVGEWVFDEETCAWESVNGDGLIIR